MGYSRFSTGLLPAGTYALSWLMLTTFLALVPALWVEPGACLGSPPLDHDIGLRLVQVRASLVFRKAIRVTQFDSSKDVPRDVTHVEEEEVVEEVVGKDSTDSADILFRHGSLPLNFTLSDNPTLTAGIGDNKSLWDIIADAEEKTLTNQSAHKDGEKAWTRSQHGKKTPKEERFAKAVKDDPNATLEDQLNNKTIQKAIRERVEEAVNAKVVEKVTAEHRLPSDGELNSTVTNELREIFYDLIWARRHRKSFEANVSLWKSIAFFDWALLSVALVAFVLLYRALLEWPTKLFFHGAALGIWVLVAILYNAMICARLGQNPGVHWLIGYLLEFIFSIENLFVYHTIVKAFRVDRSITQRVLFIVVNFQIAFQFILYMGLGTWLRSLYFLPYLVGVWLVYLGCQAVLEEEHANFDIMTTRPVRWVQLVLGDRLLLDTEQSQIFASRDGKTCLCKPGLLLLVLLLADFVLEVDVTVTKIEGFPSRYLCFSSSMVASFALPELFFVARDLIHRYFALKYGISLVLIFVGVQALLHEVFTITAVTSLAIILAIMLASIATSAMFDLGKGFIGTETIGQSEAQSEAQPEAQ